MPEALESITRRLVARYYGGPAPMDHASSHWQHYSDQVSLTIDSAGDVTDLKGSGFGRATWTGLPQRLSDDASVALHRIRIQPRTRISAAWRQARTVCRAMGIAPTFDAFRQACTFELIDRVRADHRLAIDRVLVIGDGFGTLSALVKTAWPQARVTLVDLGRTLLFQTRHCQRAHPGQRHALATDPDAMDADFVYCPADDLVALEGCAFDVAVNVASMQEMAPVEVARYFSFLRRRLSANNLFYCCNRERKTLVGGEVSAFHDYPWSPADRLLVDGPCPWHQYRLSTRPPFVHQYDGRHLHRLAVMSTNAH